MSSDTSAVHPGIPCGKTAGIGTLIIDHPITANARPCNGMPVAVARNVDPIHGSEVAVRVLTPPEFYAASESHSGKTGADGKVRLTLPPGDYLVMTNAIGSTAVSQRVHVKIGQR